MNSPIEKKRKTFEEIATECCHEYTKIFPDCTSLSAIEKSKEETLEVEESLKVGSLNHLKSEYADVIGCILHSAYLQGITIYDLAYALQEKLEINKSRKWEKMPNGTYHHV